MGSVPVVGFHVEKLGYHADRFNASRSSEFVIDLSELVLFTKKPPLSTEAPDP
jgi:hypothetical protein